MNWNVQNVEMVLRMHRFVKECIAKVVVGGVIHVWARNVQNAKERKLICYATRVYAQRVVMVVSLVPVKLALGVGIEV